MSRTYWLGCFGSFDVGVDVEIESTSLDRVLVATVIIKKLVGE